MIVVSEKPVNVFTNISSNCYMSYRANILRVLWEGNLNIFNFSCRRQHLRTTAMWNTKMNNFQQREDDCDDVLCYKDGLTFFIVHEHQHANDQERQIYSEHFNRLDRYEVKMSWSVSWAPSGHELCFPPFAMAIGRNWSTPQISSRLDVFWKCWICVLCRPKYVQHLDGVEQIYSYLDGQLCNQLFVPIGVKWILGGVYQEQKKMRSSTEHYLQGLWRKRAFLFNIIEDKSKYFDDIWKQAGPPVKDLLCHK